MGKRYLPRVFRRTSVPASAAGTENKCRIFSFWTKKSMIARTPEQLIYNNASVDSAFVRDLEDAMSETTLYLDSIECGSQARSIFTEISLFFDTENTATSSYEESDGSNEMQSVGCAGLRHLFCANKTSLN